MLASNVSAQHDSYIYRTDIEALLEQRYDHEHTFLNARNTRMPILECRDVSIADSIELSKFRAVSFHDHIIETIPEGTNTLIISEHHIAYRSRNLHMDFTKQLKAEGFTNVYIEALAYDKDLSSRGYPIDKSGYYLHEPTMANLVRGLLDEGFNIYPYEELNFQKKASKGYVVKHIKQEIKEKELKNERINAAQYDLELMPAYLLMSTRDFSQYKNIMQTFDPNEKSIILCGLGHGIKKPYGGWRPLGYWLSQNPKVKLYSIENSSAIGQEEPELNKITCYFDQSSPYFIVDTQNQDQIYSENRYEPYESKHVGGLFDMNVFYPINYFDLQDDYSSYSTSYQDLIVDVSDYGFPLVIVKYNRSEYEVEKEQALPTGVEVVGQPTTSKKIKIAEDEVVFAWDGDRKYTLKD